MKRKKKIWLKVIIIFITILFILPIVAFAIVRYGILPPEKLTPLVVREVNKFIDGHLECEKIELTYFDTYPRLGVRITNGKIISYATTDSIGLADKIFSASDSLVSFRRAVISVNPADYLFKDKITIHNVFLSNPKIYGYINEKGIANWDIYEFESDTTQVDTLTPQKIESKDSTERKAPFEIQKVRIRGGNLIYNDEQEKLYAQVNGFTFKLDGSFKEGEKVRIMDLGASKIIFDDNDQIYTEVDSVEIKLRGSVLSKRSGLIGLELNMASLFFQSPIYSLEKNLSLNLKTDIELGRKLRFVKFMDAELIVNDMPFTTNCEIRKVRRDTSKLRINMDMQLKVSDMNDLIAFIPEEYFQNKKNLTARGSVFIDGKIHGFLGDSIVPTVDLCCKVENGSCFMKGMDHGIDSFDLDVDVHLNGTAPDSSYVKLENLSLTGLGNDFVIKGSAENILNFPYINGFIKGNIDFTRLATEFLNPDTLLLEGKMNADISAEFFVDDILDGKYNNVKAGGTFNIDEFKIKSDVYETDIYIADVHFSVDTTNYTSSYISGDDLIIAFLTVDSLRIVYGEDINTVLKNLDVSLKTTKSLDTSAVVPVTSHIKVENLRARLPDSVIMVAKNTYFRGGLKPSASDKKKPMLGAQITVDSLRYIDIPLRTGISLATNTFNIEALPYRDALRQQRNAQAEQRRDTTRRTRRNVNSEQGVQRERTQQQDTSRGILRNWEVRGSVNFNQMRVFSRLFPLPMKMDKTTVKFSTNSFTLKDAHFHAGKSDFIFSGEINSIRRAMLSGGKLRGDFTINSNYIDCNELLTTLNKGFTYAEQLDKSNLSDEEIGAMSDEEMLADINEVESQENTEMFFLIPEFLDMVLKTDIKKLDYKDLELEKVNGEVVMRNRTVNLKKLNMESNYGNGNLTMVYSTKSKEDISAGFELQLEDILVDKFIALFPSIDTLLPMLRSFEGVVDCHMAATCELDTAMNISLPSLHSACYLHGIDMVLLDGETFSEISKTLMFKNKKRNVIDSISVDLLIKDSKIEIYPFLVEMDRYRVAVGGIHNLDLTFDYHISVLKSPVPFKLGIDIMGNLDDFKYKVVKCKYKDIFKPAREQELDETRTNLRAEIRNIIREQIEANAPELANDQIFDNTLRRRPRDNQNRPQRVIEEEDSEEKTENKENVEKSDD